MDANGQLHADHAGLHSILDDVAHLVRSGGFPSATKVFGELRRMLELHVAVEETALAALEAKGTVLPRAQEMREQHERVQAACRDAWEALTHQDGHDCARAIAALGVALAWHERHEAQLRFPVRYDSAVGAGGAHGPRAHLGMLRE